MTRMLATASSIGVGTGVSSKTARENRSPWIVYWSQVGKCDLLAAGGRFVAHRARAVVGRIEGDVDFDRPSVPRMLTR